jgi:hypothetical protein
MVGFKVAATASSAPALGNNKSCIGNGAAGGGSPSTLSTSAASAATMATAAAALHAPELVPVKSFVSTALAMKLRGNGTNYVHIVNTIRYVTGKKAGED